MHNTDAEPPSELEHIDHPLHICLDRLDGIYLVVVRRCRTREVKNQIYLKLSWGVHVVPDEFESLAPKKMTDILLRSGKKIIKADDLVSLRMESVTEM